MKGCFNDTYILCLTVPIKKMLLTARPEFFCSYKKVSKDGGHKNFFLFHYRLFNKMNDFYMYILKCKDNSYYIGHTDNIEQRISEHYKNKFPCYTSKRLPVKLVFLQTFGTRDEAFIAERQIKKWSRQKKEALIGGDWNKISLLAKKKFK